TVSTVLTRGLVAPSPITHHSTTIIDIRGTTVVRAVGAQWATEVPPRASLHHPVPQWLDYGSVDDYDETNGAPLRHNHDFERYSTLPRLRENGGHSQIRSAPSHNRRPASTSGYPAPSVISTPITTGTATIRRKPSSKFNSVRRTSNAPKPVTPPTVPGNAVSNLMSTFQQPDTNYRQNSYNHNNHNNNFEGTPVYSGEYDVNGDVNPMRDMTLKFQGVDVLETPTQTPTGLEYNPGDMNLYPGISPIPGVSPLLTRD
uniref:Uncharacterized protein n=1 Tax=Ciona savignyi TaxID=51511 RepID=H2ZF59_CIOSA